ncbi:MAG: sulfotransferase domain-containing protein [Candidatus Algichlamydia australiensis]|nr:sulfotransferase domain-containing protein [Chlamydiales bacterium]
MRKIFVLSLLFTLHLAASSPEVIFLTYPRSGANWMMYCITMLTDRGWLVDGGRTIYTPAAAECDPDKNRYIHSHNLRIKPAPDRKKDYLLMIVRNPTESLVRHCKSIDNAIEQCTKRESYFFRNIQYFDKWNPKRKLLVYYEDFMKDPKSVLREVLIFLNQYDEEKLQEFLDNFSIHQQIVLQFYDKKRGGARSRGSDLLYHSKKAQAEKCKLLENRIKKHYPDIWEKYFTIYETL